MRRHLVLLTLIPLLLLTACAPGANELTYTIAENSSSTAGFWMGLWHGSICMITFVISLFSDNVNMYEVHNSGNWYNFGFLAGLSGVLLSVKLTTE
jgi:hypothetical protein